MRVTQALLWMFVGMGVVLGVVALVEGRQTERGLAEVRDVLKTTADRLQRAATLLERSSGEVRAEPEFRSPAGNRSHARQNGEKPPEKPPAKLEIEAGAEPSPPESTSYDSGGPLAISLPKPMYVGTPMNVVSPHLEKPTGEKRPPFIAPAGTANVARRKNVISSANNPV